MGHQFCKAVLEASKNVLIERIFFLAKHSSSTSNFTSSLALTDEGLLLETPAFQFSFGGTSNFIKSFFFFKKRKRFGFTPSGTQHYIQFFRNSLLLCRDR